MAISVVSTLASADFERARGDGLLIRLGNGAVNGKTGLFEHGLGRMQADHQIADRRDGVRVLPGVILPAVDPGAGLGADETDGVVDRRPGDAKINRSLDDLRHRAIGRGLFIAR